MRLGRPKAGAKVEAVIRARLTAGENHRYAALIAGMALGCLPCNGRNAVATAAIAANEQRKIGHRNERNQPDEHDSQGKIVLFRFLAETNPGATAKSATC